ncbi:mannitol dehydrogenase [Cryptococcus neoformans Ze90-1]|nr:mannitol dehydrogenase [Cryptococcus neoformans var. grubii Ze90-1]
MKRTKNTRKDINKTRVLISNDKSQLKTIQSNTFKIPLAAVKKINDFHMESKEEFEQSTKDTGGKTKDAETESAQRRLERKLRRRERAAINKPKLLTPLRPASKSKRKIKSSSIDGSKQESEGSFILGSGKKMSKKYRAMPEIVKIYQAKNVQAGGRRITAKPVQKQGFLSHGKASLPIRLPSEKARMAPPQPFSEDQFLGSHSASLDPMMDKDKEIWSQWKIQAPQPNPMLRPQYKGKRPQQQLITSPQLVPSRFQCPQRSPTRVSSTTSIMPSNHRQEACSASQLSNAKLPPPGLTNSPSWHTEITEGPSYKTQQHSPGLDKKTIQSEGKATLGQTIISIQSDPKLELNPTVDEGEPTAFVGSISNNLPFVGGSNGLASRRGVPWKENMPSFGRPNHTGDLSFGGTPIHSVDNEQAIGYFQRSQNTSPSTSFPPNGAGPNIEGFHNPPQFQFSSTSVFQSMGDFMGVRRAPTENGLQLHSDALHQQAEFLAGQLPYQTQPPDDMAFRANGPSTSAMPQLPISIPFQLPRYNQSQAPRQNNYPYRGDGNIDPESLRLYSFFQQHPNRESLQVPLRTYQGNQQISLSKYDSDYHTHQADIMPLNELQPQAMSSYEPPVPIYQDIMADSSRLSLASFDWAFDPIEPQRQFRFLDSSTNIRSKRPTLVPSTINNNPDLNVLNGSHDEPLNEANDQYLSFDHFDQPSFAEQGMWQERPSKGAEEQVGVTEEDWHRLWGQRSYIA